MGMTKIAFEGVVPLLKTLDEGKAKISLVSWKGLRAAKDVTPLNRTELMVDGRYYNMSMHTRANKERLISYVIEGLGVSVSGVAVPYQAIKRIKIPSVAWYKYV
jgi:hypothetical protein